MAFQPAFGHMFTDFSVKKVYMAAILLFEVGSIICATASHSIALIIGRLIAGAGGGGLYVGTLTYMGLAVPIQKRPFYISLVTSMFGVASVAGLLLGGVFTDSEKLTWRFCFWINVRKLHTRTPADHSPDIDR
jgi:MFS family permease